MRHVEPVYDPEFYDKHGALSYRSAAAIVPEVLRHVPARSVIDFGCGVGTWLRAFSECGVEELVGVDGAYVNRDQLQIPSSWFVAMDLSRPAPVRPERFDLAMSLETAEHLPPSSSEAFVRTLVESSDAVLFGAAIPGQRGRGHVNERWQPYWANLFAQHGYGAVDILRPRFWDDPTVAWWYPQNTFLYLKDHAPYDGAFPMLAAHPALELDLAQNQAHAGLGLRRWASMLPSLVRAAVRRRRS